MPDEYVTVAEIAELLRLNPQTVRNWIDRGELPAVRVGRRRVRVRQSDLDAFLKAGYSGNDEGQNTAPDQRADFAVALDRARVALNRDDEVALVEAIRALAAAAERLATALGDMRG